MDPGEEWSQHLSGMISRKMRMRLSFTALICICFSCTPAFSGQAGKPDAPQPSQQISAEAIGKLRDLAKQMGCHSQDCVLLVTDFTTSESTSRLAMQVSDAVAKQLSESLNKGKVLDRSLLHEYLEKERIPSRLLTDVEARRWLGQTLHATTVVSASIDTRLQTPEATFTVIDVNARLKSKRPGDVRSESFSTKLPGLIFTTEDLAPSEVFGELPPLTTTSSGDAIYRTGTNGVKAPRCTYMPTPSYSDPARRMKVNGVVLIDAVITPEGNLENARIVRGLPGGLNENALAKVRTWRCNPAVKDGKPVAVLVPLEINFRLY